ncbi:CbtA family protein [Halobellus sp. EA9]|uniref:CbtA family protein n=1 Tax=Halobellus sp. EA9 TaxID=3421647 RepID=UPI003EB8B57F
METLTEYLRRGVLAGAVAGVAFGVLLALVANPLVGVAEGFGHGGYHALDGHAHASQDSSVVSATVTNAVSVVSGVLWGILLGGVVFGAGFYFLEPILPGRGATQSYLLAAAGFVTVSGAPWLVLPPRPPGVAEALPADTRTLLYAGMMVLGAAVCLLSAVASDRLRAERSRSVAVAGALLPFGLLAVPAVLAPGASSAAAESALPPELAAGFTGLIVLGQALLWLLLAGTHARLRRTGAGSGSGTVGVDSLAD